ncbi:MAG: hypothetical protein V3T23_13465 [Nitrososphaerales archaeon]
MSQSAILAEIRSLKDILLPKAPYFENENLTKASAVSTFGSTLEIAGQEFSQFIIRTDGDIHDISYRAKTLKGGFTKEIELVDLDVFPGPVDVIQFKNDNAESGKSIFVYKIRHSSFISGFAGGRSKIELFDDSEGPASIISTPADGVSNTALSQNMFSRNYKFDGAGFTWDRERNNHEVTLLDAANRTASTNSPDQTNHNQHGAFIHLDVATDPGNSETLQLKIQFKEESISNNYVVVLDDGANVTPGERTVLLNTGIGVAAEEVDTVVGYNLPRRWRAQVIHSASGTWNYSLVVSYIV